MTTTEPIDFDERSARATERTIFARLRQVAAERRMAVETAAPALERLCQVMRQRPAQGYKLRALLYSLWNGKATSLLEVVELDWELRQDLGAVLLAFGNATFFYDQIKAAVCHAQLWDWFLAAGDEREAA